MHKRWLRNLSLIDTIHTNCIPGKIEYTFSAVCAPFILTISPTSRYKGHYFIYSYIMMLIYLIKKGFKSLQF